VINTLGQAGAETALMELLRRLQDDYRIDLYVLMGQGEMADRLPEKVRLLNRRFIPCSVLSPKGRIHMAGTVWRAMLRRGTVLRLFPYLCQNLWKMLIRHRVQADKLLWRVLSDGGQRISGEYDLAVAFLEGGAAYYTADHVKARKKAAFIHIDYGQAGYTRMLDRDCYLKFDALFPIAEETKEKFLTVYPECRLKTMVFHNLLDREGILKKASLEGGFTDDYDGMRILTVGRLTAQKAYPVAILTMKLLKEAGCRARWYVLGEGEERRGLERRIAEYGLKEDFLLPGAVENPYPYYRQADIYVHATRYEGKSIAVQEAQILGCAIVASDCSGNREQIVTGEDGILCPLEPEALRDAVMTLLQDKDLRDRLGKAAARRRVSYEGDMDYLKRLLSED